MHAIITLHGHFGDAGTECCGDPGGDPALVQAAIKSTAA